MSDLTNRPHLSLQDAGQPPSILVLGEVLWDVFEHSSALGGAPLNFAAHAKRLGYDALLISAVGADSLGNAARQEIAALGLDTSFLQTSRRYPTGTARVSVGPEDRTCFVIERPAAYDAISIREDQIAQIIRRTPACFYYGTLFACTPEGRVVLDRLLDALPAATRFYDLNLRPGNYSAQLVIEMCARVRDTVRRGICRSRWSRGAGGRPRRCRRCLCSGVSAWPSLPLAGREDCGIRQSRRRSGGKPSWRNPGLDHPRGGWVWGMASPMKAGWFSPQESHYWGTSSRRP